MSFTNNISKYIKLSLPPAGLLVTNFFIAEKFLRQFSGASIFSLELTFIPQIAGLTLLAIFLISLTLPAWEGWKAVLFVPLPTTIGIYLVMLSLEPINALIICASLLGILTLYLRRSQRFSEALIKPLPRVIFRPISFGYILCLSLTAASIVLLNPDDAQINISERIVEATVRPVRKAITGEMTIPSFGNEENVANMIEEELESRVIEAISPYRHLTNVILAILVFAGMKGLGAVIHIVYDIFLPGLFWLMRKLGYFKTELVQTEKEILRY